MLAEARKYRVALTLAHQDLSQFPRDLLAAVSANARNKVYFSVAPEDAKLLARHTEPELSEHDLAHLDAYTAAARLMIGGRQTSAFTLKTRPPRAIVGDAEQLRADVAEAVPPQPDSPVEKLINRLLAQEAAEKNAEDKRHRRPKGSDPKTGNPTRDGGGARRAAQGDGTTASDDDSPAGGDQP
jgi:hypothetical protein